MGITREEKNKLFVTLMHLLFKRYQSFMDNKTAFVRALHESSHAKIKDEEAAEELVKMWKRKIEPARKMRKIKRRKK